MSPAGAATAAALRSGLVVQVDLEVSINTKPIADIASTADPRCMVGAVRTRPPHTHRHGGDGCRCRWCGSKAGGIDCPYYPTGVHEHSPSSEKRPRGRAMNRRVGPGLRHVAKCGRHPPSQPAPPCVRTAPWHGRKPPTLSASFAARSSRSGSSVAAIAGLIHMRFDVGQHVVRGLARSETLLVSDPRDPCSNAGRDLADTRQCR